MCCVCLEYVSVSEMRYLSGTINPDTFWVRHCKNYNECHNTGRVGGEVRTEQVGFVRFVIKNPSDSPTFSNCSHKDVKLSFGLVLLTQLCKGKVLVTE